MLSRLRCGWVTLSTSLEQIGLVLKLRSKTSALVPVYIRELEKGNSAIKARLSDMNESVFPLKVFFDIPNKTGSCFSPTVHQVTYGMD